MRILFLGLLISALLPHNFVYGQESNAGIVQGLWYSNEVVFAGETTRIYVAIRNNTGSDLTGTIEFFDGDKKLERKQVQALDGRIIESWADWTPTYGTHTLTANLSRTELFAVGSTTQEVEVVSVTASDTLFVDYDTDKDGTGNQTDTDDDQDGVSDTEEIKNNTNPLVVDLKKETVTESQNTTDNNTVKKKDDSTSSSNQETKTDESTNSSQGLEQYLAPSRAQQTIGSFTNYITTTKKSLDTYREERKEDNATTTTVVPVNADGFGEIKRSTDENKPTFTMPSFDGAGFFDKLFNAIGKGINTIYTLILTTISLILGHPALLQFALLLLILFILFRFASKLGRRPTMRHR
jgi:hypothetical protein